MERIAARALIFYDLTYFSIFLLINNYSLDLLLIQNRYITGVVSHFQIFENEQETFHVVENFATRRHNFYQFINLILTLLFRLEPIYLDFYLYLNKLCTSIAILWFIYKYFLSLCLDLYSQHGCHLDQKWRNSALLVYLLELVGIFWLVILPVMLRWLKLILFLAQL